MNGKIILFFSTVFIFSNELIAQGLKYKMAQSYFNKMAYADAYPYYKDIAKNKKTNALILKNAGICAYNLMDFTNAENYFKQLLNNYPSEFNFNEAEFLLQSLKYNKKYSEINQLLDLLEKKKGNNLIRKSYLKNTNYLSEFKKDSSCYIITNVNAINTEYSEFSPYFNATTKQLTFASNRKNKASQNKLFAWDDTYFLDTYTSKKKDSLNFFDIKSLKGDLKTQYHDGSVIISNDGKKLFLTRTNLSSEKKGENNLSIKTLDIIIHTKDTKGNWDEGVKFPYCSNAYSTSHPALSADGLRLYFSSDMPGGYGKSDLWYSDYKNNTWEKPVNLGAAVNTEGRETFPYVFENDILFYSSDGKVGLGGLDIYFCSPSLDAYFEPQPLGYPINTNYDDFGFFLNPNYKTGYFSSNRLNGKGKDDIYYFNSKKSILKINLIQKGTIFDNTTKNPIANTKIYLLDKANKKVDSTVSLSNGTYSLSLPYNLLEYKIRAVEPLKHYDKTINIGELILEQDEFKIGKNNLDLYLLPKYRLLCNVTTIKENKPIENVKITLTYTVNNNKVYTDSSLTDEFGNIYELLSNRIVKDKITVNVTINKLGYSSKSNSENFILDTNLVVVYKYKLGKQNDVTLKIEVVDENGDFIDANIDVVNNNTNRKVPGLKKGVKPRDLILKSGENYGITVAADGYLFQSDNIDIPIDADYTKTKRYVLKKLTKGSNIVLNNVFFDVSKSTLRPVSINELDRLYAVLKDNPSMKIELSGHTDNQGGALYNQKLSFNRAKAVVDYLISKGINKNRLIAVGYGFSKPVATNANEEGRQLNRRTELKIISIN